LSIPTTGNTAKTKKLTFITDENRIIFHFYDDDISEIGILKRNYGYADLEIKINYEKAEKIEKESMQFLGKQVKIEINSKVVYEGILYSILRGGIVLSFDTYDEAINFSMLINKKPNYVINSAAKMESLKPKKCKINEKAEKDYMAAKQYEINRDYESAKTYLKSAIDSASECPNLYYELGAIYFLEGDKEKALHYISEAKNRIEIEELKEYPGVFASLGHIYTDKGAFKSAITLYKFYLSYVNNNRLRLKLAELYENIGMTQDAIEEYTTLSKSNEDYYSNIGGKKIKSLIIK
jgi:tetratricopeptide (TPR) repeat protein